MFRWIKGGFRAWMARRELVRGYGLDRGGVACAMRSGGINMNRMTPRPLPPAPMPTSRYPGVSDTPVPPSIRIIPEGLSQPCNRDADRE